MKLATYKDGSRDGQLVVVSRDLRTAHYATGIAHQMQQVLDDWNFMAPQLQDLFEALNRVSEGASSAGLARHAFPFDPQQCMAPLPRAYQMTRAAAYRHNVTLMQQAGALEIAGELTAEPIMYPCTGDAMLGPREPVRCASEALDIDFEAEIAVITGDVRQGADASQALDGIRLMMLGNAISLRQLTAVEQRRGFGFIQSKPASAFSPVALTPDELAFNGEGVWAKGRLNLTLQTTWNGRKVGMCETGPEMTHHFGKLISHLCKTRPVRAGTIVASGAVSNKDSSRGFNCIAEKRAIEILQDGKPSTQFMKFGDSIRIEMKGQDGLSLFGAIDQEIVSLEKPELNS